MQTNFHSIGITQKLIRVNNNKKKTGLRTASISEQRGARQTINSTVAVHLLFKWKVPPAGRVKLELSKFDTITSVVDRVFVVVPNNAKFFTFFFSLPVDDVVIAGGCDKVWRRFLLARKF